MVSTCFDHGSCVFFAHYTLNDDFDILSVISNQPHLCVLDAINCDSSTLIRDQPISISDRISLTIESFVSDETATLQMSWELKIILPLVLSDSLGLVAGVHYQALELWELCKSLDEILLDLKVESEIHLEEQLAIWDGSSDFLEAAG